MGRGGLIPIALAVGFGITNAVVTFKPAYDNLDAEKKQKQLQQQPSETPQPKVEQKPPTSTAVKAEPQASGSKWWQFSFPGFRSNAPAKQEEPKEKATKETAK